MRNLSAPKWMYLKAACFVLIGIVSGSLLLIDSPKVQTFLLLLLVAWSFCRAYYFAFYVIERYIDPSFKYSGLFSVCCHLLRAFAAARAPGQGRERNV